MKALLILALVKFASSIIALGQSNYKPVSFSPQQPVSNRNLIIKYDPDLTSLSAATNIICIAYLNGEIEHPHENTFATAKEISLKVHNGQWQGEIPISSKTKSLVVVFLDSLGNKDNNQGEGYWQLIYKDGKPQPGAKADIAEMYAGGWHPETSYNLTRRLDIAYRLYEEEFKQNPHLKRKYLPHYLKTVKDKGAFKRQLDAFAQQNDLLEWELFAVSKHYRSLRDTVTANKYTKLVFERYPNGSWPTQANSLKLLESAYLTNDLEERKAIYYEFKSKYAKNYPDEFTRRIMTNRLKQLLGKALQSYVGTEIPDFWKIEVEGFAGEFKKYAYETGARMLLEENANIELAEILAKKAVDYQKEFLLSNAPRTYVERPFSTDRQIRQYRERDLARNLDYYGQSLLAQNKIEQSLEILRKASIDYGKRNDAIINQHYIEALLKLERYTEALAEMEKATKLGRTTAEIESYYTQLTKNPAKFLSLKMDALADIKAKLKNKILNNDIPEVTLLNEHGRNVDLNEYSGKIIVIDFWATWCAPCIAGLPSMKRMVNKYRQDKEVVFLFVNTKDKSENIKEKALKHFKNEKQELNLLFDTADKAGQLLGVSVLPTKIVIDKNHKVRFKHEGSIGNAQQQVDELTAMIELIR